MSDDRKVWADCMLDNEHWLKNLNPDQVRALAGRYEIDGWKTRPAAELLDEIRAIRDRKANS